MSSESKGGELNYALEEARALLHGTDDSNSPIPELPTLEEALEAYLAILHHAFKKPFWLRDEAILLANLILYPIDGGMTDVETYFQEVWKDI